MPIEHGGPRNLVADGPQNAGDAAQGIGAARPLGGKARADSAFVLAAQGTGTGPATKPGGS